MKLEIPRPKRLEAERGLLGILLRDNDVVHDVSHLVTKADFADPGNGDLFDLIKDVIDGARVASAVTLSTDAQNVVIGDGGMRTDQYLRLLEQEAPPAAVAESLAKAIRAMAMLRAEIDTAVAMIEDCVSAPASVTPEEIRASYDAKFARLFTGPADLGMRRISEVGDRILTKLKTVAETGTGLDPGLVAVSSLTGPWQGGKLIMLGAAPSAGKSALAQMIASFIARKRTVLYVSPEMDDEELTEREWHRLTGIPANDIEAGRINNQSYERLYEVNQKLGASGLYIDSQPEPKVPMIRMNAGRLKKITGDLALIVIDHVHYLAKPDPRMSENDALNDNLKGLKQLARTLDLPILTLCHPSTEALRDMSRQPWPRPNKFHLLYAGTIDRHADVTLILHRREIMLRNNEPEKEDKARQAWVDALAACEGRAELILGKRRAGALRPDPERRGRTEMFFDERRVAFTDNLARAVIAPVVTEDDLLALAGR
jgi:replicative DNA helicase